ncbi:MAG: tRNA dihydrouridine synthase DusB [Omnitrophica WOR_2 bacterium GWA2_47_8]|nr:MAG: tRNA dihydrouridine synthase DusB [Omnitrophica WOR_2 bacterium GWA2_47_8]
MQLGPYKFENPIILAPMEDVSNMSFRIICKRQGADIVFTEFTSSEALIRDVKKAFKKIQVSEEERPIGIQIYGSLEGSMEQAARIAEEQGPDFIDINCGCWVKKHANRGEGAGLLKDLNKFEEIVKATVRGTRLPVTVKTRLGWDENSIVILEVAKIVEQAGAKALTIHCRTRSQGLQGQAKWSWLEQIKKNVSIPIIGNGDVTTPDHVKQMLETGCDGVMIGRGAIANPWIFKQAKHYLKTGTYLPLPTLEEKIDCCIEHLKLNVEQRGLKDGVITFRKHYIGYLSGLPNVSRLRAELMQLAELEPIIKRLHQFLDESSKLILT